MDNRLKAIAEFINLLESKGYDFYVASPGTVVVLHNDFIVEVECNKWGTFTVQPFGCDREALTGTSVEAAVRMVAYSLEGLPKVWEDDDDEVDDGEVDGDEGEDYDFEPDWSGDIEIKWLADIFDKDDEEDWDDEESDPVNHPDHYCKGGLETIEVIKMLLTPEEFKGYLKGNMIKYRERHPYKGNPEQDLAKAKWYSDKLKEEFDE